MYVSYYLIVGEYVCTYGAELSDQRAAEGGVNCPQLVLGPVECIPYLVGF